MFNRLFAGIGLAATIGLSTAPAGATAVTPTLTDTEVFNFIDQSTINPVGQGSVGGTIIGIQNTFTYYLGGSFDLFGPTNVSPTCVGVVGSSCSLLNNPSGPPDSTITTVTGQLYNAQGNQVPVNGSLAPVTVPYTNSQALPGEYSQELPTSAVSSGSYWQLTVTNPATTNGSITVDTPALSSTAPLNYVRDVTISSGAQPTISWTPPLNPPAGSTIEIQVENLTQTNGNPVSQGIYANTNVGPAATTNSFTLPIALRPNDFYSIGVEVLSQTNGVTSIRANYWTAPFQTFASGPPVALPQLVLASSGTGVGYGFDIPVTAGQPITVDPLAAVGFIYQIGVGDPNFASVELPDIGNPTPYDLYLWDNSSDSFVFDTTLAPDTVFDFAAGGVSEFEILGIDPSLGLDPSSSSDFMTTLTFTESGTFTGTMTPVTQAVPEPSTWALLIAGLSMMGLAVRHRRRI